MSFFRHGETGGEASNEVKPKNQILQTPDSLKEGKEKLTHSGIDRFQDKSPKEQQQIFKGQKDVADEHKNDDIRANKHGPKGESGNFEQTKGGGRTLDN